MCLTISQWQKRARGRTTRLSKASDSFKCHGCHKTKAPSKNGEVVICMTEGSVNFFCVSCWHSVDWSCPGCDTVPPDADVVECGSCAQWTHVNCEKNVNEIDISDTYTCFDCQTSDVERLKACIFDKGIELEDANNSSRKLMQMNNNVKHINKVLEMRVTVLETLGKGNRKKTNIAATDFTKRIASQKKISEVKIEAMQAKLAELRAASTGMNKLVAANTRFGQQNKRLAEQCAESKAALVKNQKQLTRLNNRTIEMERKMGCMHKTHIVLKKEIVNSRKRERDHDDLWDVVEKIVKKSRMDWSMVAPSQLSTDDSTMWKKHGCQWRTYNGGRQYMAKIKHSDGKCPRFASIGQLLHALRSMKQ